LGSRGAFPVDLLSVRLICPRSEEPPKDRVWPIESGNGVDCGLRYICCMLGGNPKGTPDGRVILTAQGSQLARPEAPAFTRGSLTFTQRHPASRAWKPPRLRGGASPSPNVTPHRAPGSPRVYAGEPHLHPTASAHTGQPRWMVNLPPRKRGGFQADGAAWCNSRCAFRPDRPGGVRGVLLCGFRSSRNPPHRVSIR
jgi:hypothetical protein